MSDIDIKTTASELESLEQEAREAITAAKYADELEPLRVRYLGKKGAVTTILRVMGQISPEARRELGARANRVKESIAALLEQKDGELTRDELEQRLIRERVDVSLPGRSMPRGRTHPITQSFYEIIDIFRHIGFTVSSGPEVEWDTYSFECLNIPRDHPARNDQDTFFLNETITLRPHTSPVQIRAMLKRKTLPLRIISPGRVYRRDETDASHLPMFNQVEGLYVDKHVTMAQLKSDITYFCRKIFDRSDLKVRFRPSYFPFTEPSAEVDIGCLLCNGGGCSACKQSGYIEILGCGMVHPGVFEHVAFDPEHVTGYAFGIGVERISMLRHEIPDIRLYYENDYRFLSQF